MTFLWARLLWLLLLIPALVAAYLLAQRRRQKYALRYASLSLVKEALGKGPGFRRHVPPILFLAAMTVMVLALARPTAVVVLPSQQGTIILTLDNSGSMRANDVQPSRLEAAKAAAKAFVAKQPRSQKIGVVAFAGTASLVQPPTTNHDAIDRAIERLTLQRATAIGSGILTSVNAILEEFGEKPVPLQLEPFGIGLQSQDPPPAAPNENLKTAIIVLMSDGQSNTGPDPLDVVEQAAGRGIKIYTVGLGSPEGTIITFYNRSMRVRLDEATLKRIAEKTNASYFRATSDLDLRQIYESLGTRLVFKPERTEITAIFAAVAALLLLASSGLSLLWFNRLP
jgi:Ca-activated chloride channel family protein